MNIYTLPTALSVEIFDRYNVNKKLFFSNNKFTKGLIFSTNRISLIIPILLISLFS